MYMIETEEMTIYNLDEVRESTMKYFNGDILATDVWIKKYALKDSNGNIYERNPDEMHKRLAREFARIESKYPNPLNEEEIYDLLKNFKYIVPQGSPMAGVGNNMQVSSVSNCFVIGNDDDNNSDSYGAIMKLDQELVQLMKRRAGVGLDLSFIRPTGSHVNNSALTSTGVVPFMERYSNSTREVAQGGRRGALMESISIKHPDAETFIDAKLDGTKVTGANVSVRIDDEFMDAALNDKYYRQQYPINSTTPQFEQAIKAKDLWDKVVNNAWAKAEPGILFWDTIIKESIPDCYVEQGFKTVSTNPCGEITLCANDSCRLLVLNLYSYVINPFTDDAYFDLDLFKKHVYIAQRLMDDLVDIELEKVDKIINKINSDPESEDVKATELDLWLKIKDKAERGRRTGLGITAEGDMIAGLNLIYGTDAATDKAEEIHEQLKLTAYRSSVDMAKERGSFPIYATTAEENNPFILRIKDKDPRLYYDMVEHGRRNIALLTIAPTGSVSCLTQTTSGIENLFQVYYKRRRKINPNEEKDVRVDFVDELGDSWQEYPVFHHRFLDYLKVKGYNVDDVMAMPTDEIDEIVKNSPYHNATSQDVDWLKKVELQGRIQKHVDHSISVTVNLPNDIDKETVSKVYETAWRTGCKGVTVYRDGSRSGVLITDKTKEEKNDSFIYNDAFKRPKEVECFAHRSSTKGTDYAVIVGLVDNRPYEIFITEGRAYGNGVVKKVKRGEYVFIKTGVEESKQFEEHITANMTDEQAAITRMLSMTLRHGGDVKYIVEQLRKTSGSMFDFTASLARVLKKYIQDGEKSTVSCESCGEHNVIFEDGCSKCLDCGFSACS